MFGGLLFNWRSPDASNVHKSPVCSIVAMYWVLRAADHFKDVKPIVAAAIEDLEEERCEDRNANSIDHGGRRPVANLSLLRHPPSPVD